MKPLSLLKVALAATVIFLSTSFKPGKSSSFSNVNNTNYYWYLDSGTVYDGWYTTATEITRLENMYGVYVDGDPLDGTLIASAYAYKGYPHLIYASVFLYSH